MQDMGSVRLQCDIPSLEDGVSIGPESLSRRIQKVCQEKRDKRKHEWGNSQVSIRRNEGKVRKSNGINEVKKKEVLYMLRL